MLLKIQPNLKVSACTYLRAKDLLTYRDNPNFPKVFDSESSLQPTDVLAMALRHGVAISDGLAVESWPVLALGRPAEMRKLLGEGKELAAKLKPQTDAIDNLIGAPGATEEVNARADAAMEAAISDAEAEAHEYLGAPIKPDLVKHWQALGGPLL